LQKQGGVKMMKQIRNDKKGFTLVEILTAIAIIALFGGFALAGISSISQAQMRKSAENFKAEFELTRNLAKTHGGDATLKIERTQKGLLLTRTTDMDAYSNDTIEKVLIKDSGLELFYRETDGDDDEQLLVGESLTMTFAQTTGTIIGPDLLDYVILSNGNKNYQLYIEQNTGMMYYSYEVDSTDMVGNSEKDETIMAIPLPKFNQGGNKVDTITVKYKSGVSVQPELWYDARYVKISGSYRATEPGKYTIRFSLKDPYSTRWDTEEANDTAVKELEWTVEE
jgi:prepilin-type N-terminal cleavage/methylation domain-containing protein